MDDEIWKTRILLNKSKLCQLTSLSLMFLDKCVERYVLTRYEKSDIESKPHDYDKKSRFYDIILMKDEYLCKVMVEIMKETETKQSDDVLNILTHSHDELDWLIRSRLRSKPGSSRQIEMVRSQQSSIRPGVRVCFGLVQPLVDVVGRDDTLNDLHTLVTRNAGKEKKIPITSQLTCVWGLGGVGKTTLVRKYACDNCDYFDGNVIWIKADDEQQIQNSFLKFATSEEVKIQLEEWNNNREANMMKIFKFFSDRKSLFVFDNVEKYGGEVDKFLPLNLGTNMSKPYFLMTSRREGLDQKIKDFKLGVPSFEDMAQLMTTKLKLQTEDISTAYNLAVQLESLPLAVQQAISCIQILEKRKQRFATKLKPIEEYLTLLQDNSKIQTVLDSKTDDDYGKTVLQAWTTSMKTISKNETYGASAKRIMNILVYFNNDSINCDILETFYSKEIVEESLALLAEYSMIELNEGFISIHRLVQQVIQIWNKSIESEFLKDCLEILTKRPDTIFEHSYTIWKSALNYNHLVIMYPKVGIRLCENVHFGRSDTTNIFKDTFDKISKEFGTNGMPTIELNCIRIISLCHDMRGPLYSFILQLDDILTGQLRNCDVGSMYNILPTIYRLADSLLKLGKSPLCPGEKQDEIITHSLKHYERIQQVENIKPYAGVNAQSGINECRQILSNNSGIDIQIHRSLTLDSEINSIVNILRQSGFKETTLVIKVDIQYVQGASYDGVIWINADTKESMELSILKISGGLDGTDSCSAETYDSWSSDGLELELLKLIDKLGQKKYLFAFRQSVDKTFFKDAEIEEYCLSTTFNVLFNEDSDILFLSTWQILRYWYIRSLNSNVIHLDMFKEDEAVKQIPDSVKLTDIELGGLLAKKLHRFPLALHYASEYLIQQMKDTNSIEAVPIIKGYLELFEQYSAETQDKSGDKFQDIVQVVWNITKRKIEEKNHGLQAIRMIKNISYLDPDSFSIDLIHSIHPAWSVIECIKIVERYGLLTNTNFTVTVHPLLQKIIRKQAKQE